MSELAAYGQWYATWLYLWARECVRELWRDIPGPRPVKVTVMVILAACLLIPGPVDEIGVILLIRGMAWLGKRRRERRAA